MQDRVKVTALSGHLWLMDDAGTATSYLVAGSERALVIDTAMGFADIKSIAASLTDKPISVINTHGHCDHIFGNVWFDTPAMIGENELTAALRQCADPGFVDICKENSLAMPPFVTVKDGDVIDLGGLTLSVIALPGHTPGGICLLLNEDRILFTGDGINRWLWLQLEESLPAAEALKALDRIEFVTRRADRILHGHAKGFEDISLYSKLRRGLKELAEQKYTEVSDLDETEHWFGGTALKHKFDEGSMIIYTHSKLPKVDMTKEFAVIDSFCGAECALCESRKSGRCAGCRASGGRSPQTGEAKCKIAACCENKGLRYCADCARVPCDELAALSYDPVSGDTPPGKRVERLSEIKLGLLKKARLGCPKVAACGLSCGGNCFLGEWCGGCESGYNRCSFASISPDGVCPNLACAREKGIKGCWDCEGLDGCQIGFYSETGDPEAAHLAKAGAMFIRRFDETPFTALLNYILTKKHMRYTDYFTDRSSAEKLLEDMIKEYRQMQQDN